VINENCGLIEDVALRPDVVILAGRWPVLRNADSRRTKPQERKPVGVWIGQWFQKKSVGHAEERRVRANSNGQRQKNQEGYARLFSEHPQPVTEILAEDLQVLRSARLAALLAGLFNP